MLKALPAVTMTGLVDKNGESVFVVKLYEPHFFDTGNSREKAIAALEQTLGSPVGKGIRIQPIRDWTGQLFAYAIWP